MVDQTSPDAPAKYTNVMFASPKSDDLSQHRSSSDLLALASWVGDGEKASGMWDDSDDRARFSGQ